MSEAATETPTRARATAAPSAGGNFFTKKFGPLPGWGWAALAAVGAVGYMYWRNRQNAAAAAAGGDTAGAAADNSGAVTDDITGQLSTIQTEIEALQGAESTEGSSTGGGTSGSGGGGGSKYTRHTSQGNRSLNQIAKDNNTSVAHIVSLSKAAGESGTNLAKLEAWARKPGTRPKGVVWYT